jgi:hypothetical protein
LLDYDQARLLMAPPKARRDLHRRRVDQLANRADPTCNSNRHCRRAAQAFRLAAKNLAAEMKEAAN